MTTQISCSPKSDQIFSTLRFKLLIFFQTNEPGNEETSAGQFAKLEKLWS